MRKTTSIIVALIATLTLLTLSFYTPVFWNAFQAKYSLSHDAMFLPTFMLLFFFTGGVAGVAFLWNMAINNKNQ